jgi:hypothetical protein
MEKLRRAAGGQTQHVGKDAVGPCHSGRQLPKPGVAGVDVVSASQLRDDQPAGVGCFSGIVAFQQRRVAVIVGGPVIQ